nr:hypothetical transcript [Hymenolepis microstoma]
MVLLVLYVVIDEKIPYLTGQECPLGGGPGLSFLPKVDVGEESPKYHTIKINESSKYMSASSDLLSKYGNASSCDFVNSVHPGQNYHEVCMFPLKLLGRCQNPSHAYLNNNSLCIYVKMNKIFGYLPDVNGKKIIINCSSANDEPKTRIEFFPSVGYKNMNMGYFSTVTFPYLNQNDFQSPLLAILVPRPSTTTLYKCRYENMNINEEYVFILSV